MNVGPSGRLRRWSGRSLRFAAGQPVGALLLFAGPPGVASLTMLLGRPGPGAGTVKVGQIVLLLLSSALLFGAGFWVERGVWAVRRGRGRGARLSLWSSNPPIEQIAADLRRMLWRHDMFARSSNSAMSVLPMRALEAAISRSAAQAARALGVSHPDPRAYEGFDIWELRRLLRTLTAEGLVLPPEVGLIAPDRL